MRALGDRRLAFVVGFAATGALALSLGGRVDARGSEGARGHEAAAGRAAIRGLVATDVQMPGTQPEDTLADLHTPNDCAFCHGSYNPQVEPTHQWRGSMMSHASRDPLFWATLAVVEQDYAGAGDFCLRCHVPSGWLAGRSVPTDGAALDTTRDVHGVECDQCHRLTNPDGSEHAGVQNPPFVANSGGVSPQGYYGSGQYVLSNDQPGGTYGTTKLGPYANAGAPHTFAQSQYHRSPEMCGTCHDVSNPFTGDLAPGNGAQVPLAPGTFSGTPGTPVDGKAAFNNFPYQYGVVERTYSELKASALDTTPVADFPSLPADLRQGALQYAYEQALQAGTGGNHEDGTPRFYTCQTCHMAPTVGQGCSFGGPARSDLARHDLTGGNYWIPDAIQWLDQQGLLILGGGLTTAQVTAMNDGKARARASLSRAAGLSVGGNTLRVVNLTGHKLITGYPEGRRMWIHTRWYDASGALVREDGAYGPITAVVQGQPTQVDTLLNPADPNSKVYESQGGISQAWAQKLITTLGVSPTLPVAFDRVSGAVTTTLADVAAQAPGTAHESFHFLLNDTVLHDNRIPPYRMDRGEATLRNALPVPPTQFGNPGKGSAYNYWDQVTLNPPVGATFARIDLVYQPTSWEYIQFLWRANTGQVTRLAQEGVNLLNAWRNTGMAAPHVMASTLWGNPPLSVGDCQVAEGDSGTANCDFAVSLPGPVSHTVLVSYATSDGTATVADNDYAATSGFLSFPPNTPAMTVSVPVNGDTTLEPNETFTLTLSNASGAVIQDGVGQGTIQNDETPSVSIGDCTVVEGNSGTTPCVLPVTLSAPTVDPVNVSYTAQDFTATVPADYAPLLGTLTFAPGTTSGAITASVVGDVRPEPVEQFFVGISATGASPVDDTATATIVDDDGATGQIAEIAHGTRLVADLRAQPGPAADRDVYLLAQQPYSSYEVVVDGASGDLGAAGPLVERLNSVDAVLQPSSPVGTGSGRALRWVNGADQVVAGQRIAVSAPQCATACGADDVYRLRAYETTYAIPRFNNTGSQVTVLIVQNLTDRPVTGNVWFWAPSGVRLFTVDLTLAPHETSVVSTPSIVPNESGSVTIGHDGGYGALAGKAVALEPATGFSFDSPLVPRAR
jgi:hypothetical protein